MSARRFKALLLGALVALAACAATEDDGIPLPELDEVETPIVEALLARAAAVREAPKSAEAWGGLGVRLRTHGWHDEALVCFGRAEELAPSAFDWPYLQGHLLAQKDPEAAAQAFGRALAIDRTYAPAHVRLARVLIPSGAGEEAERHFREASQLDPDLPQPFTGLGQLALDRQDPETARELLERALALSPDDGEAHRALARTYTALGDANRAEQHARSGRDLPGRTYLPDTRLRAPREPIGSVGFTRAAAQREREGRLEEAAGYYEQALALKPDLPGVHYNLGTVLARLGRLDQAVVHYRRALELNPDYVEAWWRLGRAAARQGRTREARAHWNEAVSRDADHAEAQHDLGLVLLQSGASAEAVPHLRRAATLRPARANYQMNLALALGESGELEESVGYMQVAAGLEPDDPAVHYNLGAVLARLGRFDEARVEFLEVLRMSPADADARRALEELGWTP